MTGEEGIVSLAAPAKGRDEVDPETRLPVAATPGRLGKDRDVDDAEWEEGEASVIDDHIKVTRGKYIRH